MIKKFLKYLLGLIEEKELSLVEELECVEVELDYLCIDLLEVRAKIHEAMTDIPADEVMRFRDSVVGFMDSSVDLLNELREFKSKIE